MYDASLNEHWVDLLVAALIALVGYFGSARFSDMERRHNRAEDKFEKVDEKLDEHGTRITLLEGKREGQGSSRGSFNARD